MVGRHGREFVCVPEELFIAIGLIQGLHAFNGVLEPSRDGHVWEGVLMFYQLSGKERKGLEQDYYFPGKKCI